MAQGYDLKWNEYQNNLSTSLMELFKAKHLVDVTLVADGDMFSAHRLILSALSPYFREMFTQMPVNQHAFVFLKDVSQQTMADLIEYMYMGEVKVQQDALNAFIDTAKSLGIKGLTNNDNNHLEQKPSSFEIWNQSTHGVMEYRTSQINQVYKSSAGGYENAREPAINIKQYENVPDYGNSNDIGAKADNGMNNNDCDIDNNNSHYNFGNYAAPTMEQYVAVNETFNESQSIATALKRIKPNHGESEYTIKAVIQKNVHGRENLLYNGYKFCKGSGYGKGTANGNGRQRWRCTKESSEKCRASVNTMVDVNGVTMMKVTCDQHSH